MNNFIEQFTKRQAPKCGSEYYPILERLSPYDQDILITELANLYAYVNGLGIKGGLELLAKLGMFIAKREIKPERRKL